MLAGSGQRPGHGTQARRGPGGLGAGGLPGARRGGGAAERAGRGRGLRGRLSATPGPTPTSSAQRCRAARAADE